jgi:hypothetical protein
MRSTLVPSFVHIEGSSMCAHLSSMILQPCFRVEKIDYRRFRGSIAGLGFAYCDFYKHDARAEMISRGPESRTHVTRRMPPSASAHPLDPPRRCGRPLLSLRPSSLWNRLRWRHRNRQSSNRCPNQQNRGKGSRAFSAPFSTPPLPSSPSLQQSPPFSSLASGSNCGLARS